MKHRSLSRPHCVGISLEKLFWMLPDDATSKDWFAKHLWKDGNNCSHSGSTNMKTSKNLNLMLCCCCEKEYTKRFSTKIDTVMEGSKLGFQIWMIANYLLSTSFKLVSCMRLHRVIKINQ